MPRWVLLLSLLVTGTLGCSVDVDGYEFVESPNDGGDGDGDTGDGDGDDEFADVYEELTAQWATPCIEGDADEGEPGLQYVYTFEDDSMRLDMWAFTSDCSQYFWVQSIEADFEITERVERTGRYALELTITDYEIMLLAEEVAETANTAGPTMEGLYGKSDWEAFTWIDLLGIPTDNGTLYEGDTAYILVGQEDPDTLAASLITLGAIPAGVIGPSFERTDGELGADNL